MTAGGWLGIAAAVMLVAAFALPSPPPSPDAPRPELVSFLTDRRDLLLASTGLIAAGGR